MRALGVVGVLGAVAALLAAYLLFFDHDPRDRGTAGGGPLLVRFEPRSVARITVARAGEPPFALVRSAGGWRIQPGDGPADEGAIDDLLNALAGAESDRTADLSAAAAGLTPPRLTLSIEGARAAAELRFGRPDAGGRGVFVQAGPHGPIHVGPRRLLDLADRPASALRAPVAVAEHRLLPVPPDRVRRVELTDGARRLVLARGADGGWQCETSESVRPADPTAVTEWLARLARAEVRAPAETGRRLAVDGAPGAVTIGPEDPSYVDLDPDPARFRSRKVLDFAHFDARELRRISAAGTIDARSTDGETWSGSPPVDARAVSRVVGALGNLRAAEWLAHPPPGRPDLVLEVSVQAPGDPAAVLHTVEVWPNCSAETKNAGAFRVAQDLCGDLRLDPASANQGR